MKNPGPPAGREGGGQPPRSAWHLEGREALAALILFWEAVKQEVATVELVKGVIGEVKKAKPG